MIRNSRIIFVLLIVLNSTLVAALPNDRELPILLEADSVELDELTGISVYKGNVSYIQGSLKLTADVVKVHKKDGQLYKLIANGSPASYSQLQEKDGIQKELRASAEKMEFLLEPERLILEGNAHVWRDQDEFTGNYIEYDSVQDVVNARKSSTGKERVQVVIQPRKKSEMNESGNTE